MNVLFIGDVVGRPGRRVVKKYLPELIKNHQVDLTIINGENAAHGKGITIKLYHELLRAGGQVITLGNHAFAKSELLSEIDKMDKLVRPRNLYPTNIGQSTKVVQIASKRIAISSVMGEVFMNNISENPYISMTKILNNIEGDIHIVDFHAEATAEKQTFFHLFKDELTAIIGTHTHVQTADERVVNGCAYITDVGMSGVIESVLGRDIEEVIERTVYNKNTHYTIATGPAMLNGVLIKIEDNRAVNIQRIHLEESS